MITTNRNSYSILGIMSGTSLDGLDIGHFIFKEEDRQWRFEIKSVKTYDYTSYWVKKLSFNPHLSAVDLLQLDHEYGKYIACMCLQFIDEFNISKESIDLISSHGHTLFHQPQKGFTKQIGNGPELTAICGINSVCDFRVQDVALGGQGAPLVPIGDELLFSKYEACINLGGFANISLKPDKNRIAFDICPLNFVLNQLCRELGKKYDDKGYIAREGNKDKSLIAKLNTLEYFNQKAPKTLGAEWVKENVLPLLEGRLTAEDKIRSYTEHVAWQITRVLNFYNLKSCLFSGGGTYNEYLLELIRQQSDCEIKIPPRELIDFKEALIFAFMGLLKVRNEVNVLSSVSGALNDHSSGIFYNTKINS